MGKRYSFEEASLKFYLRGFILAQDYTGARDKHKLFCMKGGHYVETYATNVFKGRGCPKCSNQETLTLDAINDRLAGTGLTCTSRVGKRHVEYTCAKGHRVVSDLHNILKRKRCGECHKVEKLTQDEVKDRVEAAGFNLLEDYKNASTKLKIECKSCGNVQYNKLQNITKAVNCCDNCGSKISWTPERADEHLRKKGFILDSYTEPFSIKGGGVLKCLDEGHEFSVNFIENYFRMDLNCPICHPRSSYLKLADDSLPHMLYYLRVDNGDDVYYKIGITSRSVEKRFYNVDLEKITVLDTLWFDNGAAAFEVEQHYLKLFAQHRYRGKNILQSGNSELFTRDVLSLDKSNPDTLNQKPL